MKRAGAIVATLLAIACATVARAQTPADSATAPVVQAPADSAKVISGASAADTFYAAPALETDDALEQARELLRDADYDRSIEVLKEALEPARANPERLRDVYLLLVKTYVFNGNALKFKPQGREASNLNYQEARRLTAECLRTLELRHTQPDSASDPPEMIQFFDETRRQIFGAYRVLEVVPKDAVVLLDGDTLRALPGETRVGDVDILAGPHVVVVRARGHKDVTDRITISPGVTLARSYRMTKRRGSMWYATRAVGALGLVGGTIAAVAGGSAGGTPAEQPLPGAPQPPGR